MPAKHISASISPPKRVQILKARGPGGYWKSGQFGYAVAYSTHPGMYTEKGPSEADELVYLVSKSKNARGGALWFSADALRFTGARSLRGFTIEEAWKVAMAPGGSQSVVDLEDGGYAVPRIRGPIAPPSKRKPIAATIPTGKVKLLPGPYGGWRIVRRS
jgi:hypothetical protein